MTVDWAEQPEKMLRARAEDVALTEIEQQIYPHGLQGTVEATKREWFDRGRDAMVRTVDTVQVLATVPVGSIVVDVHGTPRIVARLDDDHTMVPEVGLQTGPLTNTQSHHLMPMRIVHVPTATCGECDLPSQMEWVWGDDGAIIVCRTHASAAPPWTYLRDDITRGL